MKVKELIEKLKQYPQDRRVVVSGYEGGVDDIYRINEIPILINYHARWYYGKHEECEKGKEDEIAVLISKKE